MPAIFLSLTCRLISSWIVFATDWPKGGNPMPTYDYYCEKCKQAFSLFLSMSEHAKRKARCPKCKSKKVKQQIAAFTAITSSKS
jgi:putative FmdB family regulatory protein